MDELRFAFRRLATRPGPSLISILTLACAIGAAAATTSLLTAVLVRPLPVEDPDRLVVVGRVMTMGPQTRVLDGQLYSDYLHIRDGGVFERVAAGGAAAGSLPVTVDGVTTQSPVYFASADFFDVLGVRLEIGRTFTADEDRRGAPLVAIVSERYWRRALDSDPSVLGRAITLRDRPAIVVGVAARGFRGVSLASAPDVYVPLHAVADLGFPFMNYFEEPNHVSSPTSWITVIGRLGAGSSPAQALARLSALADGGRGPRFVLTDIDTAAIPAPARGGMRQFTRLLGATVALLLLIGCSTVGMLLLVRTEARQSEFATCLALGASRLRLARGVALEGALLALAGAGLAIPIAHWLFAGVRSFRLPGGIALESLELRIDPVVFVTAAASAAGATLLVAFIAGVFGFRADIADGLRARSGATPRLSRRRTRSLLVAGQVAMALVLLAGAGLFARTVMAALSLNAGFETNRIMRGSLVRPDGSAAPRPAEFYERLGERLRLNPAIRSFATYRGESSMGRGGELVIDGTPREMPSTVPFWEVDAHYFATMGMRIIEGRNFSEADSARAPLVAIVSQSMARLIGDGGTAVGRRMTLPFSKPPAPAPVVEVVGVVPDVITDVTVLEPLVLYAPVAQNWFGIRDPAAAQSRTILARAAHDVRAARRELAAEVKQLDPQLRPNAMLTIQESLAQQMMPQRFGGVVLGALAFMATLLTMLGAYVMAESMAILRTREMGIRAALGATASQLAAIVLGETLRLVGIGLGAGLLLAWAGASTIRSLLFQVEPLDPVTLLTVACAILVLTLGVSLRPAVRAARVDLASVLRAE